MGTNFRNVLNFQFKDLAEEGEEVQQPPPKPKEKEKEEEENGIEEEDGGGDEYDYEDDFEDYEDDFEEEDEEEEEEEEEGEPNTKLDSGHYDSSRSAAGRARAEKEVEEVKRAMHRENSAR